MRTSDDPSTETERLSLYEELIGRGLSVSEAQGTAWPESTAGRTTIGVTPLHDNVIIETMSIGEKIGSIWVPDCARKDVQAGRVVAVGPGRLCGGERIPAPVEVGDGVLYTGAWQGEEIERDGKRYRVLENQQLAAVIPASASDVDIRHLVP